MKALLIFDHANSMTDSRIDANTLTDFQVFIGRLLMTCDGVRVRFCISISYHFKK